MGSDWVESFDDMLMQKTRACAICGNSELVNLNCSFSLCGEGLKIPQGKLDFVLYSTKAFTISFLRRILNCCVSNSYCFLR